MKKKEKEKKDKELKEAFELLKRYKKTAVLGGITYTTSSDL